MHKDLAEEYAKVMRAVQEHRRQGGRPEMARLRQLELEGIATTLADSLERAITLLRKVRASHISKVLSDEITEFLNEDPRAT